MEEGKKGKARKKTGAKSGKQKQARKVQKGRTLSAMEMLLPKHGPVRHSKAPIPAVKLVQEPHPTCPICGQPIDLIEESLTNGAGQYCHFDCVLDQLKSQEQLSEGQSISYIGSGRFAVVAKNEQGSYTIVKEIPYESREQFDAMKKYVEGIKA